MTLDRVAWLVGVALLVMVLNIVASVLYMVIYGHLINPGHPPQFYQEHVKVAAPYCSIVAGIPLMFLAGYWVAGWWGPSLAVQAALTIWAAYALVDLAVLLTAGMNGKIAAIFAISFLTKLLAVYGGALAAAQSGASRVPAGAG
ncbi:MAG: hypothetical protein SF069_18575 [Phycisphaerae bacterium]|nr:hypothetical protein [Phycisphaerae bacterium]